MPLPKQTTGQNQAKLLKMFIYNHKQMNQTLRKSIFGGSHMQTGTPRQAEETPVVKELVLVILKL